MPIVRLRLAAERVLKAVAIIVLLATSFGCETQVKREQAPVVSAAIGKADGGCKSLLRNDQIPARSNNPGEMIRNAIASVDQKNIGAVIAMLSSYETRDHRAPDYGYVDCLIVAMSAVRDAAGSDLDIQITKIARTDADNASYQTGQPSIVVSLTGAQVPSEMVILGAHLDSVNDNDCSSPPPPFCPAPGADDNASGVAVLVEAFRLLSHSLPAKRTIEIHFYASEEEDLRGSRHVANKYLNGGNDVVAYLNFDMVSFLASEDDRSLFIVESGDSEDLSLVTYLQTEVAPFIEVPIVETACSYPSDHRAWTGRRHFSASMIEGDCHFSSQLSSERHRSGDTMSAHGIDMSHATDFGKLGAAFALSVANSSIR